MAKKTPKSLDGLEKLEAEHTPKESQSNEPIKKSQSASGQTTREDKKE